MIERQQRLELDPDDVSILINLAQQAGEMIGSLANQYKAAIENGRVDDFDISQFRLLSIIGFSDEVYQALGDSFYYGLRSESEEAQALLSTFFKYGSNRLRRSIALEIGLIPNTDNHEDEVSPPKLSDTLKFPLGTKVFEDMVRSGYAIEVASIISKQIEKEQKTLPDAISTHPVSAYDDPLFVLYYAADTDPDALPLVTGFVKNQFALLGESEIPDRLISGIVLTARTDPEWLWQQLNTKITIGQLYALNDRNLFGVLIQNPVDLRRAYELFERNGKHIYDYVENTTSASTVLTMLDKALELGDTEMIDTLVKESLKVKGVRELQIIQAYFGDNIEYDNQYLSAYSIILRMKINGLPYEQIEKYYGTVVAPYFIQNGLSELPDLESMIAQLKKEEIKTIDQIIQIEFNRFSGSVEGLGLEEDFNESIQRPLENILARLTYPEKFFFLSLVKRYGILSPNIIDLLIAPNRARLLSIAKSGSDLQIVTGGSAQGLIYNIIKPRSAEIWRRCAEEGIPCAPFYKVRPTEEGKEASVLSRFCGLSIGVFRDLYESKPWFDDLYQIMLAERKRILRELEKLGIQHGHPHVENFTVEFIRKDSLSSKENRDINFLRYQKGEIVFDPEEWAKNPDQYEIVVRIIDFDRAEIPISLHDN